MDLFYVYFLLSTSYILLTEFFIEICFSDMKLTNTSNNSIICKYQNNIIKVSNNLKKMFPLFIIIELYYIYFNGYNNIIYNLLKLIVSAILSINVYSFINTNSNTTIDNTSNNKSSGLGLIDIFSDSMTNIMLYSLIPLYSMPLIINISPVMFKIWIILSLCYLCVKDNNYIIEYKNNKIILADYIKLLHNNILIFDYNITIPIPSIVSEIHNMETKNHSYNERGDDQDQDHENSINDIENTLHNRLSKSLNDLSDEEDIMLEKSLSNSLNSINQSTNDTNLNTNLNTNLTQLKNNIINEIKGMGKMLKND
jgi:hypothetical protein